MAKENEGIDLVCKCGHAWRYTGNTDKYWTSCPRCRTNVDIVRPLQVYPGESIPVRGFIGYWATARHQETGFDGHMLSSEYRKLVQDLAELRSRANTILTLTTESLYPSVEEPAAWHAAVDPDFIEEGKEIANQIAVKKGLLQSLRTAITEFVKIAEGPTLDPILREQGASQRKLNRLVMVSEREQIANVRRGRMGLDTQNPKLNEATLALQAEQEQLKSSFESCTARVQACYKIIQSRESIAAVPKAVDVVKEEKAVT